jgi:hypothetical protein
MSLPGRIALLAELGRLGEVSERFWERIACDPTTRCWVWTGTTKHWNHYGRFQVQGAGLRLYDIAHRFSYEFLVGPVPAELELDHLCRNRQCVNPAHLEPVTHAENQRRAALARGRKTA